MFIYKHPNPIKNSMPYQRKTKWVSVKLCYSAGCRETFEKRETRMADELLFPDCLFRRKPPGVSVQHCANFPLSPAEAFLFMTFDLHS